MKIVVKKPYTDPPYSLHDAYVMAMEADGDTLRLVTQYGYVRTTPPPHDTSFRPGCQPAGSGNI